MPPPVPLSAAGRARRRSVRLTFLTVGALLGAPRATAAEGAAGPPGELRLRAGGVTPTVESWGPDCGPRPRPEHDPPGTTYRLDESGALTPVGGRARPLFGPGICGRASGLRGLREGRPAPLVITCASPDGSGKQVRGEVRLRTLDRNTLEVTHAFAYDWRLKGSHCAVRLAGRWTLARVRPLAAPDAGPPAEACADPGPPVRLRAAGRPRRWIRPGGRLPLVVRAEDAAGCPVEVRPVWTSSAGEVAPDGVFTAAGLEAGARVTVTATLPDTRQSVSWTLLVADAATASPPDDDDVIAAPPDVVADAPVPLTLRGEGVDADAASSPQAAPGARSRALLLVFVGLGALAVLLGLVVAWRVVASRRRRARLDAQGLSLLEGAAARSRPPNARPVDDTRMMSGDTVDAHGRACPRCGTRYGLDARFCGRDGAALVPHHHD